MQLKLRHFLLFIIACLLLAYAQTIAGSLIAMALAMQLVLFLYTSPITKKAQIAALKLFLISAPTFWFWGGVSSFVNIYLSEGQYLFFLMALCICLALSILINIQVIYSFQFLQMAQYDVFGSIQLSIQKLKDNKKDIAINTIILILITQIPWMAVDWKFILAFMVIHLRLNPSKAKQAIANF
jgi:hypothetical protein